MPRDGSGIYTTPVGTTAVPDTTIESAKYNNNVNDVAADLNAARPVVAGGTGATSAAAARTNLQVEVGAKQVTNYDTHVFEPGSFYSLSGATGAPAAADLGGTCLIIEKGATDDIILYAYELNSGKFWGRGKAGGVWYPWIDHTARNDGLYVNTTGDTMTGALGLDAGLGSKLLLAVGAGGAGLYGYVSSILRWSTAMGTGNFAVTRYDDAGVAIDTPLVINRANGHMGMASPSAALDLNKTGGSGASAAVNGYSQGVGRWAIELGNTDAETGSNAGSNFKITAFNDAGVGVYAPIAITRANGAVAINSGLTLTNTTIGSSIRYTPSIGTALYTAPLDAAVGNIIQFQNVSTGNSGAIAHTAGQAGVAYNTASDERLKQHREELVQTDARAIIDALRVYDYDKEGNEVRGIGLIAQQAYGVHKSLATPPPANAKEGEDIWMLEKAAPVAFLIANVQQLNARIDELEALLAQFKPPEKPTS